MLVVQLVNNLDIGGAERMAMSLATALRSRGMAVEICCIEDRGTLADVAEASGIRVTVLEARRRGKCNALWSLRNLLQQHHPAIIHSHNFKPGWYGAIAKRLGWAAGHLHTKHGVYARANHSRWRYRLLRAGVGQFVAVSAEARAQLAGLTGLSRQKVTTLPNGIDTERFRPAPDRPTLPPWREGVEKTRLIITVARLSPEKDLKTLLRAFALLRTRWPQGAPSPRLLLVGDGPCRAELVAEAARLGINNSVEFLGSSREVASLLAGADLFVLSSAYEGQSIAILEAMACGLPVIATAVGGTPELVDTTCGMLVPVGAPAAMAKAMEKILLDRALAAELGARARQRVVSHFSLKAMAKGYLELYRHA